MGQHKRKTRYPKRKVNGVLLLDKPAGLTSNGVLQEVKRLFSAAKAGHTGSLDPLATGVLPLCFGEATKFSAVVEIFSVFSEAVSATGKSVIANGLNSFSSNMR